MSTTTNLIEERYWNQIWELSGRSYKIERELVKENTKIKLKMVILSAILLLFFSIPLVPSMILGRLVSPAEFLTFEAYNLDSDIQVIFTPQQYYQICQFIYKWLGFAAAACLLYWAFLLNPFDKLRKSEGGTRVYIQEIVHENPKSPAVFLKHVIKATKFRWLGFFYMWFVGFLICSLYDASSWTFIMQHQYYWFSKIPSIIPLALLMLLFVNVTFGVLIGLSRPKTRAGSKRKVLALIIVGACLFATIILALMNAPAVQDYIEHWNDYSIKYPENPSDPGPTYWINYNALFWTLAMISSGLIAFLFPVLSNTYQNMKFRAIIKKYYKKVLEKYEKPWEYIKLKSRHDVDDKRKKNMKIWSAFELAFFFGLVLIALWGFYFYWGILANNKLMENLGIGIMAFELIWAIAISPIVHYHMERSFLYQGKRALYVLTEDRGIGAWKKFWQLFNFKRGPQFSPEEKKKMLALRRFIIVLAGIMVLWICGLGVFEDNTVGGIFKQVLNALHVNLSLDEDQYHQVIRGLFSIGFMIVAPVLLIYSAKILKFNDVRDPDRGKKRIYGILWLILLSMFSLGSIDLFNKFGVDINFTVSHFNSDVFTVLIIGIIITVLLIFLLVVLCFPIFVRLDDLFESINDLISLFIVGIVILVIWNYFCEWFFVTVVDPSTNTITHLHWSWLTGDDQAPSYLRDNFNLLKFFTGTTGYFYWGWVQELLFLGYFCWLLYKIQPNKYINAIISSLLFMMFHWDDIALMIGTAIAGFAWALWWDKRRNLFILGWTHGYNGTLVNMLIPMSMTVGPGAHF
ncbi:MAG: CPBP family glutamic-type intramembrane protease [Promethearchaeota archaeon]